MKVFHTKNEVKAYLKNFISSGKEIGFVPTMGALHQGHLSLVSSSKKVNYITVVSIFVNPTQFDNKDDLDQYPKTLEKDLHLLGEGNCDMVFVPSVKEMYENNVHSKHFDFDGLENEMEGRYRKGHFDGVGTIVNTFFDVIKPTRAYFGEKDFQQLQIIKRMVKKLALGVEVIGCPIHREANGLAMSSRNERLTLQTRKEASIIHQILLTVKEKLATDSVKNISQWVSSQFKNHPLFELEYFTIANESTLKKTEHISSKTKVRAFIAVYAESVRLIDNLSLNN